MVKHVHMTEEVAKGSNIFPALLHTLPSVNTVANGFAKSTNYITSFDATTNNNTFASSSIPINLMITPALMV